MGASETKRFERKINFKLSIGGLMKQKLNSERKISFKNEINFNMKINF